MKALILRLVITMGLLFVLAPVMTVAPARAACTGEFSIDNGINCATPTNSSSRPLDGSTGIFVTVINLIIYVIGALAILLIVIGGLRYVVSGGDAKGTTDAKNTILYAVIGLIIAIAAYAIVRTVVNRF